MARALIDSPRAYSKPGERIYIAPPACDPRPAHYSKNLRGILDHARRSPVNAVYLYMTDDYGARVHISFDDGYFSRFQFAAWDVAQRWFRARRSWGLKLARQSATSEEFVG